MIEAPDASRLLSGERADTNRPTNGCAGRGRTPDKSASGRFVCHVASPLLPPPGDVPRGFGKHTDNRQPSASQRYGLAAPGHQFGSNRNRREIVGATNVDAVADGGATLDNSCGYPQMMEDWFINIACINQSISSCTPFLTRGIRHDSIRHEAR
jgi:hypothetical protein